MPHPTPAVVLDRFTHTWSDGTAALRGVSLRNGSLTEQPARREASATRRTGVP